MEDIHALYTLCSQDFAYKKNILVPKTIRLIFSCCFERRSLATGLVANPKI